MLLSKRASLNMERNKTSHPSSKNLKYKVQKKILTSQLPGKISLNISIAESYISD
jgi:hypothetical protein